MFYSLLGRMVWFGLKLFLRRKHGAKSLLAGGTVAVAVAVMLAVLRATRSRD
jgi:hypothetical protein